MSTNTTEEMARATVFSIAFTTFLTLTLILAAFTVLGFTSVSFLHYLFPVLTGVSLAAAGYTWYQIMTVPEENYDTELDV